MEVIISILVGDPVLARRCKDLLVSPAGLRKLNRLFGEGLSYQVNDENTPEQGVDLVKQLFLAPDRSVIVISDLMAGPIRGEDDLATSTPWWYELIEAAAESRDRLGSIAISDWAPRRLPDIDRVVKPELDEATLFDAIRRTIRTLEYKQRPQPRQHNELIVIRHVRTPADLRAYYRLRHRIYSLMGYLDHEVESVPTAMEIDWCDLFSVPIAAFSADPDGGVRLVGTTRIITTKDCDPRLSTETERIAREDETGVLSGWLDQTYRFQMPFLQSHPDEQILTALNRHFADAFCEISRVIVDRDHRGIGLSKMLMTYSMTIARRMGMKRIFLECLPTHRRLYEQFRFRLVPGRSDRVYKINKTMDLMEWAGPAGAAAPAPPLRGREEADRLRKTGYLCQCGIQHCPAGDPTVSPPFPRRRYTQFLQAGCPLAVDAARSLLTPDDRHIYRQWPGMETCYED
jgi:GNAT superfamily N-acetyltransferase